MTQIHEEERMQDTQDTLDTKEWPEWYEWLMNMVANTPPSEEIVAKFDLFDDVVDDVVNAVNDLVDQTDYPIWLASQGRQLYVVLNFLKAKRSEYDCFIRLTQERRTSAERVTTWLQNFIEHYEG